MYADKSHVRAQGRRGPGEDFVFLIGGEAGGAEVLEQVPLVDGHDDAVVSVSEFQEGRMGVMLDLDHRAYRYRIGIAAFAALLLLGVATESRADCWSEWNSSSASESCEIPSIASAFGYCRIITSCETSQGVLKDHDITIPQDDVADLNNCNGELQTSDC